MRVYVIPFFALVLFAVAVGILFADSKELAAQDGNNVLNLAGGEGFKGIRGFEEIDLVKAAFPKTPSGCGRKASFFSMAVGMYNKGNTIEQVSSQAAMFTPLFEDVYNQLKNKDMADALMGNMEGYIDCIKGAEKKKDTKSSKDTLELHEKCVDITEFAVDIVKGVKGRRNKESLLNKYAQNKLDFEGTPFEKIENADEFLIHKIYDMAGGSYETAAYAANMITIGCYNK